MPLKSYLGKAFGGSSRPPPPPLVSKGLSIHILLTQVWLVFILQHVSSPVFMTASILVNKLDNCFVVHLLEPAMKRCFTRALCSLGSNIGKLISCHRQAVQYQETLSKYRGYWQRLQIAFDMKCKLSFPLEWSNYPVPVL